jgi:hypothetical protein
MRIKQDLKIQALGSPVATACVHACGQFADLLDRAKQENGLGRLGVHGGDYEWRIASGRDVTPAREPRTARATAHGNDRCQARRSPLESLA